VWTYWQREFAEHGRASYAIDLRGHGASDPLDLSRTSIWDYVDDVANLSSQFKGSPVVMGWSMRGHVAVLAAARGGFSACVAFDPDPPAATVDDSVALDYGVQQPQEIGYAVEGDPALLGASMPGLDLEELRIAQSSLCGESLMMASERKRGIVVETMPCPLLEVIGGYDDDYLDEPGYHDIGMADHQIMVSESSHWGLVLDRRVLAQLMPQVLEWLSVTAGPDS